MRTHSICFAIKDPGAGSQLCSLQTCGFTTRAPIFSVKHGQSCPGEQNREEQGVSPPITLSTVALPRTELGVYEVHRVLGKYHHLPQSG